MELEERFKPIWDLLESNFDIEHTSVCIVMDKDEYRVHFRGDLSEKVDCLCQIGLAEPQIFEAMQKAVEILKTHNHLETLIKPIAITSKGDC
jgi:hypothetical protein